MIRKKVTGTTERLDEGWRDVSQCAAFEVTSEEVGSALENALTPNEKKRLACTPGHGVKKSPVRATRPVRRDGRRLCDNSSISAHQRPPPKKKTSTSPSKKR